MPLRIKKGEESILTLQDWMRLAPPAGGSRQWAKHKSAMTCAEVWLEHAAVGGPPEILSLLETHPAFRGVVLDVAEPEVKQEFDDRTGGTRNSDLEITAHDEFGAIAIAVEAKAGESLGETVASALVAGVEAKRETPNSKRLDRVDELARSVIPARNHTPDLGGIRYQLLTATAGVLAMAQRRGVKRAVLLIHEFVTARTNERQHSLCESDLNAFLKRLSGDSTLSWNGTLLGPFLVPGQPLLEKPAELYIGKAQRSTRPPSDGDLKT